MPTLITSLLPKIISSQAIAAALLACGLSAAPAQAGSNRTFVSGTGTDSGVCTRAAPCRTFAFALSQTNAGGEINVLDTAGYGPVAIAQAVSIVNGGGVTASVQASSGNAITINAGGTDSVHLRGLTIEGLGSGFDGIQFNTGGNLAIENCVIRDFTSAGIDILPSTASSFSVSNTIVSNNSFDGIVVVPTGSAVVTGVLSTVITNDNSSGIVVYGGFTTGGLLNFTIVDSEASNNSKVGIFAGSFSGDAATAVMVRNSVASNNGTGLEADTNANLRIAHSKVAGNGTGVFTSDGGNIFSYGDNDIDGNTNDNTAALTTILPH